MTKSISEVAKEFNISVTALRFYDNEGLFPDLKKVNGIRRFEQKDIEALRLIECLKKSGLEISDIRQFMLWCREGKDTYKKRYDLFCRQRVEVENEIKRLKKVHALICFKQWYYKTLTEGLSEEELKKMIKENLPEEMKKLWDLAHSD
ncbi:MAG: MerR family transcriptional regulator [Succinivibrio sp.]